MNAATTDGRPLIQIYEEKTKAVYMTCLENLMQIPSRENYIWCRV